MPRKHSNFRFLRRHKKAVIGACLFAAVPFGVWMGDGGEAIADSIRDPLALLALRSPGERGDGATFASKPPRQVVAAKPTERVLAMVRERPAGPPVSEAPLALPQPPLDLIVDNPAIVPNVDPGIDPGLVPSLCCETPANPPTAPVPEPSTWLMMLVGFFATGFMMRRRPAALVVNTRSIPVPGPGRASVEG